jgi:hypothetical protein
MVGVRLSRTEACRPESDRLGSSLLVESFPVSGGLVLRTPNRNRLVVLNDVTSLAVPSKLRHLVTTPGRLSRLTDPRRWRSFGSEVTGAGSW